MAIKKSVGQLQAESKLVNVTWTSKRPPYNVGETCGLPVEAARKAVEVQKLAKYTNPRDARKLVMAEEKREQIRLLEQEHAKEQAPKKKAVKKKLKKDEALLEDDDDE